MYSPDLTAKCKVVKKITDSGTFFCLKPAVITLIRHSPEPLVLCADCARELAKEVIDSVPDGPCDISRNRRGVAR